MDVKIEIIEVKNDYIKDIEKTISFLGERFSPIYISRDKKEI